MRRLFAIIFFVLLLFGIWWMFFKTESHDNGPKQEPLKVGKHSKEFNQSVSEVIAGYLSLKDAFVDADTAKIKLLEKAFAAKVDSINISELQKDTTGIFQSALAQISDIKSNADAILKETDITEMRQDFRMVSENLFPLLKTIHYEGVKLYWQNCPMAFGEGKDANWISNTEEIFNPYLGKNHPEFKGTMLHCGEIKDTIQ